MPLTRTAARDEILALVKTVTDGFSNFVSIYDDTKQDIPTASTTPLQTWARVQITHGPGSQTSLADSSGKTRYTKFGLLTIQVFTPVGDGLTNADTLVESLESGVRNVSTPNGVWFKNVRSNEIGVDGPWFQTNVLAEFQYDQVSS